MRNRMYGGVRGRKTKVGEKLLRFPPTRFLYKKILFFFAKSDFYSNFAEKYKERIKNAIKITR